MDEPIDMERRAFFCRAGRKMSETVAREADRRASARAAYWIRPPFALDELEFLLACTRCGECVAACPHHVIFKLPARLGVQVVGTPALDLLNKACQLCDDWPCLKSCAPGALQLPAMPKGEPAALPLLSRAAIDTGLCIAHLGPECGACATSCPIPGALRWDGVRPFIEPALCIGCARCRHACITDPPAVRIESIHRREDA